MNHMMSFGSKIKNIISKKIDDNIRRIEEIKRQKIGISFESTVNFLISKNTDKGFKWLDQLKYLERNPFVDEVKDIPSPFTKGREHRLIIRLVQSNYRIKRKTKEIFRIDIDNDFSRVKAYEFYYSYYKPMNQKNDNEVRLYFSNYEMVNHNKEFKSYIDYGN